MNPYIDAGRHAASTLDNLGYLCIGVAVGVVIGFLIAGLLTRR